MIFPKFFETAQAAPSGVLNNMVFRTYMQQKGKRTSMPKCAFNEFALHMALLYIFSTASLKRTSWKLPLVVSRNSTKKYLGETSLKILE